MQFTCFSALPTEIRLQIWDEALHQETDRRLVLVRRHNRTIIPTKWIMSPFLIVNNESRERAKDFYSYVIDVYTIARTIGPFPGGGTLVPGDPVGKLRISLTHDRFWKDTEWEEIEVEVQVENIRNPDNVAWRFTTKPMRRRDCIQVERLLTMLPEWSPIDDYSPGCDFCDPYIHMSPEEPDTDHLERDLFELSTDRITLYIPPETYFGLEDLIELDIEGLFQCFEGHDIRFQNVDPYRRESYLRYHPEEDSE